MSKPQRQHPIIIFTGIIAQLKGFVLPVVLGVFLQSGESFSFAEDRIFLYIFIGILVFSGVAGFLKWFFFVYTYSDGALHIKSGIFIKKHRYIKRERVQTINIKAGIILRMLNLVSVQIETAGGFVEPELNIAAVSKPVAEFLRKVLKDGTEDGIQINDDIVETRENANTHNVEFGRLVMAGITSGGVGVIFSLFLVLVSQIIVFISGEVLETFFSRFMATNITIIALGIFIILLGSWVVSVIKFLLGYAFFSVERDGDEIQITRGLIEKKQLTLKLHRIQAVTIVEGLMRQPFGYGTLQVEVAGGSSKEESYTTVIHPLLKLEEIQGFLDAIIPGYEYHQKLNKLPKRSIRRYIFRGVFPFLLLIPGFFFVPYGWLGVFVYPPVILLAYMRYRDGGYYLKDDMIIMRFRCIARTTSLITRSHIQAIELKTNFLQKIRKLTTISATVLSAPASTTFTVKDISSECGEDIWSWYSRSSNFQDSSNKDICIGHNKTF